MFHPPEVDRAINAAMDSISILDDAMRSEQLDEALRDRLMEATGKMRVANQSLSRLSARS